MPSWWPNDVIDWARLKNFQKRGYKPIDFDVMRILVLRGYAYYGLDANKYIDSRRKVASQTTEMAVDQEKVKIRECGTCVL